ncbi:hypothetical protein K3495_g1330 [Podosphaera aphanis]|nr:hypothetical protein K3495_g1330 [Podosphaera aphanis]
MEQMEKRGKEKAKETLEEVENIEQVDEEGGDELRVNRRHVADDSAAPGRAADRPGHVRVRPMRGGDVNSDRRARTTSQRTPHHRKVASHDIRAPTRLRSAATIMTSVKAYPQGKTFLQTLKRSFDDVPVDHEKDSIVSTTEFLEAAEALTTLFDVLGSIAFQPVKSDLLGNIKKVRDRQAAAPTEGLNLQDLVRGELKLKKHTATEGLVWLVRGLDFTSIALTQNIANPSEELSTSFRNAYSLTLKPHHSFMVKPIFSAAMGACPYRKTFYAKLGADEGLVLRELDIWLSALRKQTSILKTFLDKEAKW